MGNFPSMSPLLLLQGKKVQASLATAGGGPPVKAKKRTSYKLRKKVIPQPSSIAAQAESSSSATQPGHAFSPPGKTPVCFLLDPGGMAAFSLPPSEAHVPLSLCAQSGSQPQPSSSQ